MEKKTYRKLSERITLTMAFWLIVVTALATLASFWHISSIVTQLMEESLEKYIVLRGERESQSMALAERTQQLLGARLTDRLGELHKYPATDFDKVFTHFKDGAYREKDEINNFEHASYFIPKYLRLTPEIKSRATMIYDFLDRECYLSLAEFNNCWIADMDGAFGSFVPQKEGYSSRVAADFRSLEQIWMTVVTRQEYPERVSKWTRSYFDPHLNNWMITLVSPIYVKNQLVAVVGYDMFITELLRRVINVKLAGTKNFILSNDGELIAHPDHQEQIEKADGSLLINKLKETDPTIERTFDLAQKEMPFYRPDPGKHVFNLDKNYILALTRLEGPDWYLATLYPKKLVSAAAYNASKYILLFGCLGLILELLLLGHLVRLRLGRPMKELISVVQKVSTGDLKAKINTETNDEFEILGNAFNEMTYNLEVSRNESHEAMEKAVEASKIKSQFVANISHEMRTPLNGILGMTHFLNETNLTPDQKKFASFITESGNNLLNIINQVIDVSRLEERKYELDEISFDLQSLLDSVKDMHFFAAKQKGLPIDFDNRVPNEGLLWGDAHRLKQVLSNLVANAIKFSDVGAITVLITETSQDALHRRLHFSVKDQGIGISKENQEKLFEQFSQGDGSMSRKYGGTGLGLYLVKSFVTLMGGEVGMKSLLGQGSEFWFEVPLRKSPSLTPPPHEVPEKKDLSGIKPVLVVEDNFINQVFTEALIKKLGLTSFVANNGQIALEVFERDKFSLILMDCQMPVMDGYEATRAIRQKEGDGPRIPIIALTANTENKDREACLESGMDDMLSKPVKIAVFKEKIDYWISKRKNDPS